MSDDRMSDRTMGAALVAITFLWNGAVFLAAIIFSLSALLQFAVYYRWGNTEWLSMAMVFGTFAATAWATLLGKAESSLIRLENGFRLMNEKS